MLSIACPICRQYPAHRVLEKVHVVAEGEKNKKKIGGLRVYECPIHHHIFFVCVRDLEDEAEIQQHELSA